MKTALRVFVLLCTGLASASVASAQQVLSYVVATPGVDESGSFTNWFKNLQVPAFDGALGVLTEVRLTFAGTIVQSARGENLAATAAPYSYDLSTSLTLSRVGGALLFAPAATTLVGNGASAAFDGAADFSGLSGFTFSQTIVASDVLSSTSPTTLAEFTGAGTVDFLAAAVATSSVSGSGVFASQTISKAAASLTVDYAFTPIPEIPYVTIVLAGLSFGAVALRRWRRPVLFRAP